MLFVSAPVAILRLSAVEPGFTPRRCAVAACCYSKLARTPPGRVAGASAALRWGLMRRAALDFREPPKIAKSRPPRRPGRTQTCVRMRLRVAPEALRFLATH